MHPYFTRCVTRPHSNVHVSPQRTTIGVRGEKTELITSIIILAITGIAVGLASGLLGVGGCFIMVPVQFWVFQAMGVSPDIAILLAFGTNLLVVLPTVASSAVGHSKRGVVWWRAGIFLGIASAVGAVIGATIAAHLPAEVLTVSFGIVVLAGAIRMLTANTPAITQEPKDRPLLWVACGFPIGIVSGTVGIGGGVLMIPVMVLLLKFRMHLAVGTSNAVMIATSIGGVIGYVVNGLGAEGLPAYSIGYVNLVSCLSLAVTSVPMAQVGVMAAHRLPAKGLKYLFITVMVYMGLKMVGVFGWLPI
ncbi:MAG: sulfite exporter TauE/SafE family protein [Euryarchaeota archaeon]|nr:sulfite exporter TauE/SafE family protein [Euryarchaeota archaeon]